MKIIKPLIAISLCFFVACSDAPSRLEIIKKRGELHVVSRYGLVSYYLKDGAQAGLEYDLAKRFAHHLGVRLNIVIKKNTSAILQMIEKGKADIAAAGLTITPTRKQVIRFGPIYQNIEQQLVYRYGNTRPKSLASLSDGIVEVTANSSHAEQLAWQQKTIPNLTWTENTELSSSDLLELVQLKLIDYTLADSNEIEAHRTLFPELRVAFNVSKPQSLAWGMPLDSDDSLYHEVTAFFNKLKKSGELAQLLKKYYGHTDHVDYVDTRVFHHRILTRLPKYQTRFKKAAEQFGFDWKLLAAISYQESHWQPDAISHTGVKGLMMLTKSTAEQMGIQDREDPTQSIKAGAKYLAFVYEKLADTITEPDRTWLALASYNIGPNHVQDARVLTKKREGNPNLWSDVKLYLPEINKTKRYKQTKRDYARGNQAVRYVKNIRRYYDILTHTNTDDIDHNENSLINQPSAAHPAL